MKQSTRATRRRSFAASRRRRQHRWLPSAALAAAALGFAACSGGSDDIAPPSGERAVAEASAGAEPRAQVTPQQANTITPTPTREPEEQLRIDAYSIRIVLPEVDYTKHTVPLREIESGGVGADSGIVSLHDPKFESLSSANEWILGREPVVVVEVNEEARIYPIQVLIWHEVANDVLGGEPIVVTFCPLCNSAIAFDRRVGGEVRDFGVSGLLRHSDLLLWDYQTATLWQQLTGEGIVGTDAGELLELIPAQIVSFEDARQQFPDAQVLSRDTGFDRAYGMNPYTGYDDIDSPMIFETSFSTVDAQNNRLPAKVRVLAVEVEGDAVAFPFEVLSERIVMHETVGGQPLVAFWQPGTATALDTQIIPAGPDIGAAGAFLPVLDGRPLDFEARDGAIVDIGTGSQWSVLGAAVAGPLTGARLEPVTSGSHFWFAWSVFKPHTRVVAD